MAGAVSQVGRGRKELHYTTLGWKGMAVEVTTNAFFQAGTPKLLFPAQRRPDFTMRIIPQAASDFLFLAPVEQTGQTRFTVVLNWQAGLKK